MTERPLDAEIRKQDGKPPEPPRSHLKKEEALKKKPQTPDQIMVEHLGAIRSYTGWLLAIISVVVGLSFVGAIIWAVEVNKVSKYMDCIASDFSVSFCSQYL